VVQRLVVADIGVPYADVTSPTAAAAAASSAAMFAGLLLLLLILPACRWVQAECRGLGEHDAPEVDPTLASPFLLLLLLLLVHDCLQVGAG
jgi:hypothetical protein